MWELEFTRDAARALLRMPRVQAIRIRRKLDELAKNPQAVANVKKLTEHLQRSPELPHPC